MPKTVTPEFSRPVVIETLKESADFAIEADDKERKALARRFGVLSIDALTADLSVEREMGAIVHLAGHLTAKIVQSCVVSLAPVTSWISAAIDRRYAPAEAIGADDGNIVAEDEDPPDILVGGIVDIGEAVAEQLALEIEPFPRAEGVEFEGYSTGPERESASDHPFASLESLLRRPK